MARLPSTVLSPGKIKTAELCALDLWWGIDFVTGKPQTSDQAFLEHFTKIFQALQAGSHNQLVPLKDEIGELMRVCGFWAQFLNNKIDLNGGAMWIESNLPAYHSGCAQSTSGLYDLSAAISALEQLAAEFSTNQFGRETALSSRALFFLVPDMQIYNISAKLAEKICFTAVTKNALADFYAYCEDMMAVNAPALNALQMPSFSPAIADDLGDRVRGTDWWQRRVLDLALLLQFNLLLPRADLSKNRP